MVRANEQHNVGRDTAHLHPSEMSKKDWCPRQSYFRIVGAVPEHEVDLPWFRLSNIYEEGHYIHAKYQTWLWEMGVLEGQWHCFNCEHRWWSISPAVCSNCASLWIEYDEVPLESEELMLIGHADGIWNDADLTRRALIEIKSIGLRSIELELPGYYDSYKNGDVDLTGLWKKIQRPFGSHMRQGQLYMHVTGIGSIIFIYEFKANQEFKLFEIKYQPRFIEDRIASAQVVKAALAGGAMVKRPLWVDDENTPECVSCPFRKQCWHL